MCVCVSECLLTGHTKHISVTLEIGYKVEKVAEYFVRDTRVF